jgi:8-oxo-dGTP pyrophosphatase MutT (NUDIX family)
MSAGFAQESENVVFKGHIITVGQGTFRAPDGTTFSRDIVRHPGAVAVVPLLADDRFALVRQYRAPIDAELLELPAGLKDIEGEAPIDAAQRELVEETGLRAGRLEPLTRFVNSAGFSDEEIEIFLATELSEEATAFHGIEEQHMTVERVTFDEALAMIHNGELRDAKSVVGILLTLRRLGR